MWRLIWGWLVRYEIEMWFYIDVLLKQTKCSINCVKDFFFQKKLCFFLVQNYFWLCLRFVFLFFCFLYFIGKIWAFSFLVWSPLQLFFPTRPNCLFAQFTDFIFILYNFNLNFKEQKRTNSVFVCVSSIK